MRVQTPYAEQLQGLAPGHTFRAGTAPRQQCRVQLEDLARGAASLLAAYTASAGLCRAGRQQSRELGAAVDCIQPGTHVCS